MKEWELFLSSLDKKIGSSIVDLWLRKLRIIRFDAANLYLEATDPLQITWFEEHIRPLLKHGFFNENNRKIKVHLIKTNVNSAKNPTQLKSDSSDYFGIKANLPFISDPIDPSCTLDNFWIEKENAMSHKLFTVWLETGFCPYNPIFLYGPKGSGKTHLLMGVATICEKLQKKWLYVTANTFTEHVVHAIRGSQMQPFRQVYRDLDVLLIDNIDQLAGRSSTQEEFFHTFNALHLQNKQIIVTSTTPPSKLQDIEFRLISRFEWGIPIGIANVSLAKIIEQKAKTWQMNLSEELLHFFVQSFPIHAITALQALILRAKGQKTISIQLAKHLLADFLQKEQEGELTSERILKSLSIHFGIRSEDILGKSQVKECALPRQIAMYVCREKLQLPYQKIGKLFGRDHSTVMSSIKQILEGIEKKNQKIIEAVEAASRNH